MASAKCTCEHDKKDHVRVSATAMGACKICLCNAYQGESRAPTEANEGAIFIAEARNFKR